ncbi:tyrosine-type recombinase/integrase [Nocardioides euryhalodurans]|uniref:Site-specific integrase n=1 Tax=Nocardioides euryhalodurans TaxID=2518370 RepID=A0A4P7GIR5_9ACTN|nr:site-specific integrase [Nocardioides euryhalodurans]QBR91880.1 site-specific integrase [Nocardioides euryhalodurans]
MGRPRTAVGTFGEFTYLPAGNGKVKARVRFRDDDGQLRLVQATGDSRKAAERALKLKVSRRDNFSAGSRDLSADSTFGRLVDVWLADLDVVGKLAPSTRSLYERNMRQLVMPAFENYTLREIDVRKVDQFIKKLTAAKSYSTAKQARTVLSLALGLAVRYGALKENPVRGIARMHKPPSETMALTLDQVEAIRAAVRSWRRAPGTPGPPPDGQLEQIIEVMLGTSARIGEVLAIRRCDVDVTVSPATVRICGTIVSPAGKPTYRQPHPKTQKSTRVVSVPSFVAEVIRQRLVLIGHEDPEHLLFFTRNETPLTTNNVRRRLRAVLSDAGIEGVTPHAFRRTVATVLDRASGPDLAAELLGHSSSKITKEHYIEPDEAVDPVTAEILESLAPKRDDGLR